MDLLRRYWFEFEFSSEDRRWFAYWPSYGIGVTAYNFEDALTLVRRWVVRGDEMPKIATVIEDVDVSVVFARYFSLTSFFPRFGCPVWRGVWHPGVNLEYGPDLEP